MEKGKRGLLLNYLSFFCSSFFYAEVFIQILFTSTYSQATPVFRVYLFFMLRQCFEKSIPIRSLNKNRHFIISNAWALTVNIILLFPLYKSLGILGPALAFVISDIAQVSYSAVLIMIFYKINLKELLMWSTIRKIALSSIIGLPFLFFGEYLYMDDCIKSFILSVIYLTVYYFCINSHKIDEFDTLVTSLKEMLKYTFA